MADCRDAPRPNSTGRFEETSRAACDPVCSGDDNVHDRDVGGDRIRCCRCITSTEAREHRVCCSRRPVRIANLATFTLLSCACWLSHVLFFSVQVSTVTTVQKAFGLTSFDIGAWFSAYTAAEIVSGVLVTYFAGQRRTPRVLAAAMLVCGAACFLHVVPHFAQWSNGNLGSGLELDDDIAAAGGVRIVHPSAAMYVCGWSVADVISPSNSSLSSPPPPSTDGGGVCSAVTSVSRWTAPLLAVASAMFGLGYAPLPILTLVYVDDNAVNKEHASFYQSLLYGVNYFGYLVGYAFAAGTLTHYVDLSEVSFSNDDERWIGAWWLGYIVCGCLNLLLATPMFFFPPRLERQMSSRSSAIALKASEEMPELSQSKVDGAGQTTTASTGVLEVTEQYTADNEEDYSDDLPSWKMFFPTLWRLVNNPVYVLAAVTLSSLSWVEAGFHAYLPKYLELAFHQTATAADLQTGVTVSLVSTVTVLAGGWVVSRFKLSTRHCIEIIFGTYAIGTALYVVAGSISCPQQLIDVNFKYNTSYNCTGNDYFPVCINGSSYFSPCHAGCYNMTVDSKGNVELHSCFCSPETSLADAHPGMCRDACGQVMAYVATVMLAYALPSFSTLAGLTVLLRCVKTDLKGFSLGIYYEFLSLAAWLPSPMVYGKLIDGTCLRWNKASGDCSDGTASGSDETAGSCAQHDNADLRLVMNGLAAGTQGLGCVLAAFVWIAERSQHVKRLERAGEAQVALALPPPSETSASSSTPEWHANRAFAADTSSDDSAITAVEPIAAVPPESNDFLTSREKQCRQATTLLEPVDEHTRM